MVVKTAIKTYFAKEITHVGTDHHGGSLELQETINEFLQQVSFSTYLGRNLVGESTKLGVNLHGDVTTVLLDTTVGFDLQGLETLSDDRLE